MRLNFLLFFMAGALAACTTTQGTPASEAELGYRACEVTFDCGTGRYCNDSGFCWSDCRTSADCDEFCNEGTCSLTEASCQENEDCPQIGTQVCTRFGQCLEPDGSRSCDSHEDCGENRFCNGTCTESGSSCGSNDDCPVALYPTDKCAGTCGAHCGSDNDCLDFGEELSCTPVGQCLQPGWEQWISPGQLPPVECDRDSQCKVLGWQYNCDCEKEMDPRLKLWMCKNSGKSVCVPDSDDLDLGDGPADSPAHDFRGVWGMRYVAAVVTLNLPLVNQMNTYSSNMILVKFRHGEGDRLDMQIKICAIDLINFKDDDLPVDNLAWMLIPHTYLRSLPILDLWVDVKSAAAGATFETSQLLEVRGCVLENPATDPLPTKDDFEDNPDDPRFWDQDGDGNVSMTTLMDGVLRGKVYNVQRWTAIYNGEILDADHIRGLATVENEQIVVSANSESLKQETATIVHEEADRTFFRLMRMDDDASCADLIREGAKDNSWLRHSPHLMDVDDP